MPNFIASNRAGYILIGYITRCFYSLYEHIEEQEAVDTALPEVVLDTRIVSVEPMGAVL
jgi:hypothetical protein